MEDRHVWTERVVDRYRRLWDDYFPTSQHSSTPVKLTACLTEATTLWEANGGAIMTGTRTGIALELAVIKGAGNVRNMIVPIETDSLLSQVYSRGKLELLNQDQADLEIIPGILAKSAACLPILSGTAVSGILMLWSDKQNHFKEIDLNYLSLFADYLAVLLEVDELSERLGENMLLDPLTVLHNRKQFDKRLREEVVRASRYSINLSLVVFDIDDLESYNNNCGHMLGNLALSDIASVLKKGVREVDFVARIGGDEFGILLPETTRLGALRFADRMRGEIASYPFPLPDQQTSTKLTVCAGVANFPSTAGDDLRLLACAYEALSLAKQEGPDHIRLWGETPSSVADAEAEEEMAGGEAVEGPPESEPGPTPPPGD
jgi:diguanylate cyclase (GGDEF)-like protein